MSGAPSERLEIGRIGRPHGVHGEVMVTLVTDRSERIAPGARWWVADRETVVEAVRPHQGRYIVRLSGVDDRGVAATLTGTRIYATPLASDADTLWVHELIGSNVVRPDGQALGRVEAVEANPAHDLLVLTGGALVPMVFVVEHSPGRVVIDPPEGLVD
jgi:16S rRNA processing protein RimM